MAPAGRYPLTLALDYDYQKNVQVKGEEVTEGWTDVNFWYDSLNQTGTLYITVKKLADFEVTEISSDLQAGADGRLLSVTYKNTGEEAADDSVARISVTDPFSTTDDQAYLGTLAPGESATAIFLIDTDSGATIKTYGVDTEIRFEDSTGRSRVSESMTAAVMIAPVVPLSAKIKPYVLPVVLIAFLLLIALGIRYYLKNVMGKL